MRDRVITHTEMLEALRNVSHEDLDDSYLEPCPYCGSKQIYDRTLPRETRPVMCTNKSCSGDIDGN